MKGIYKITNKNTGQVYIGQSENCERRISEHKQKRTLTIDDWINFLGVDAFDFEIIEECESDKLDEKEQYYINKYDSINKGYNIQKGGFNNSIGEGNGRSIMAEKDIIRIRIAYANHISPKQEYEKYKDKISYSQFQAIWQGRSWSNIMPEVYTEENKEYYRKGLTKDRAQISKENLLKYRKYYVNHTIHETYLYMMNEQPGTALKEKTFARIIQGDVRQASVYKEVPIYKKSLKKWINN